MTKMCVVSGRITAAAPCPWRLGYLCIGPIRGLCTIPRAALGELGISAIRLGLSTWQFSELAKAIEDAFRARSDRTGEEGGSR